MDDVSITVKLYGNLKRYLPEKREVAHIQVQDGTTVATLLEKLHVPDEHVWMCAVNDTVVPPTTPLKNGDILEVFEPVGGGESLDDRTVCGKSNSAERV